MDKSDQLLLAVWQDISRHLDIAESTETISGQISQHVPLHLLAVMRLDGEHSRARSAATWPASAGRTPTDVELSPTNWHRLQRWLRQGEPLQGATGGKRRTTFISC